MLLSSFCFCTRYVFRVLKLILLRAKCSLTIIRHKWVARGFHHALQNPQLSRPSPCITLLTFISLRRSVRQFGSSFVNFIKSYGSRIFCKLRCNNSLTFLKRKRAPSFSLGLWLSLFKRTPSFLIPF
jgi:hypothetical protein